MSIDGASAASHDAFRGEDGSLDQTVEAARAARDAGLPLQINTTVCASTVDDLPALAWRAAETVEKSDAASDWSAMAKTKATEVAAECAETGARLHGGRGILDERRIARLCRDARLPLIYEGINAVQRDLIYRHTGEQ